MQIQRVFVWLVPVAPHFSNWPIKTDAKKDTGMFLDPKTLMIASFKPFSNSPPHARGMDGCQNHFREEREEIQMPVCYTLSYTGWKVMRFLCVRLTVSAAKFTLPFTSRLGVASAFGKWVTQQGGRQPALANLLQVSQFITMPQLLRL